MSLEPFNCGGVTALTQPRGSAAGLHILASVPAGGNKATPAFSLTGAV